MEIRTKAYPKVNLHLAVGRKRPDGYHEIASVFQLVKNTDFFDEMVVQIAESSENSIVVKGLEQVADSKNNTVYKAIELFLKRIKNTLSVSVDIKKKIPSQAGLGGGSADAGEILKVLNSIYHLPLPDLVEIASDVGSDVPFFVYDCEAAVVTGRGEKVKPIQSKKLVINLFPNENEKMSTAKAYEMLDSRKEVKPLQTEAELEEMYNHTIDNWTFYNDFELVNTPCNDLNYHLTGSGTCRFTIDLK